MSIPSDTPNQVAIITRTLGLEVFLRRAARSVLAQTYQNWKHVFVVDGGDKASVEVILSEYSEAYAGRLLVVHLPERQGMQNASNAGIHASESEFVVIHDDDDSWKPSFLQECCNFLESESEGSNCLGVATQITQVNEEFTFEGVLVEIDRHPYLPFSQIDLAGMSERNQIAPIAFLYRRKAHAALGLYNQRYDVIGDHEFLLRFLLHYSIGTIERPLANYHWRRAGLSNTVTGSLDRHRKMYARLKDDYFRAEIAGKISGLGSALQKIRLPEVRDPTRERIVPNNYHAREEEPPASLGAAFDFTADAPEVLVLYAEDLIYSQTLRCSRDRALLWERLGQAEDGWPLAPFAIVKRLVEAELQKAGKAGDTTSVHNGVIKRLGLSSDLLPSLKKRARVLNKSLFVTNDDLIPGLLELVERGTRVYLVVPDTEVHTLLRSHLKGNGLGSLEIIADSQEAVLKARADCKGEPAFLASTMQASQVRKLFFDQQCNGLLSFASESPRAWVDELNPRYCYAENDIFSSVACGLARRSARLNVGSDPDEAFWAKLGYQLVGPMMNAYLLWLRDRLREEPTRRVFFIARDGIYLEKLWKRLAKEDASLPEAHLLWCSRRLFLCGAMIEFNGETVQALIDPNPNLRVCDFLTRLHLEPEAFREELSFHGFKDLEQYLTEPHGGGFLDDAFRRNLTAFFRSIWPQLDVLFSKERELLRGYLDQIGYDPAEDVLVDLGWNGSSMHALWSLEPARYTNMRVYYFASWRKAEEYASRGIRFESYLMHFMKPFSRAQLLRESVNILETLFAGPVPSIIALVRNDEGVIEPEYGPVLEGTITGKPAEITWQEALAFTEDLMAHPAWPVLEGGAAYIEMALARLVQQPTAREATLLGAITHSEGFGSSHCIPMAKAGIHPEALDDSLLIPYRQSGWKSGFLAQVSPIQRQHILNVENTRMHWGIHEYRNALAWQSNVTTDYWRKSEEQRGRVEELQQTIDELRTNPEPADLWKQLLAESLLPKLDEMVESLRAATCGESERLSTRLPAQILQNFEDSLGERMGQLHQALGEQIAALSRPEDIERVQHSLGKISEQMHAKLLALEEHQDRHREQQNELLKGQQRTGEQLAVLARPEHIEAVQVALGKISEQMHAKLLALEEHQDRHREQQNELLKGQQRTGEQLTKLPQAEHIGQLLENLEEAFSRENEQLLKQLKALQKELDRREERLAEWGSRLGTISGSLGLWNELRVQKQLEQP